jgi:hypothetical protein
VATGHSILVIAYHLLSNDEPYTDLGADYFVQRQTKDAYRNLVRPTSQRTSSSFSARANARRGIRRPRFQTL